MSGSDIVRNFYDEFLGLNKGQEPQPATEHFLQELATRKEVQARFEAAVERLDGEEKRIVVMRHFRKKNNREVAATLNLSEPQASMRYLRAMRRLYRIIQAEGNDA